MIAKHTAKVVLVAHYSALGTACRHGPSNSTEGHIDGLEQGISPAAAVVLEIVQVQRPYHGTTQSQVFDVLGLVSDHFDVIIADPFFTLEGVGPDGAGGIVHLGVPIHQHVFTDLVEG